MIDLIFEIYLILFFINLACVVYQFHVATDTSDIKGASESDMEKFRDIQRSLIDWKDYINYDLFALTTIVPTLDDLFCNACEFFDFKILIRFNNTRFLLHTLEMDIDLYAHKGPAVLPQVVYEKLRVSIISKLEQTKNVVKEATLLENLFLIRKIKKLSESFEATEGVGRKRI